MQCVWVDQVKRSSELILLNTCGIYSIFKSSKPCCFLPFSPRTFRFIEETTTACATAAIHNSQSQGHLVFPNLLSSSLLPNMCGIIFVPFLGGFITAGVSIIGAVLYATKHDASNYMVPMAPKYAGPTDLAVLWPFEPFEPSPPQTLSPTIGYSLIFDSTIIRMLLFWLLLRFFMAIVVILKSTFKRYSIKRNGDRSDRDRSGDRISEDLNHDKPYVGPDGDMRNRSYNTYGTDFRDEKPSNLQKLLHIKKTSNLPLLLGSNTDPVDSSMVKSQLPTNRGRTRKSMTLITVNASAYSTVKLRTPKVKPTKQTVPTEQTPPQILTWPVNLSITTEAPASLRRTQLPKINTNMESIYKHQRRLREKGSNTKSAFADCEATITTRNHQGTPLDGTLPTDRDRDSDTDTSGTITPTPKRIHLSNQLKRTNGPVEYPSLASQLPRAEMSRAEILRKFFGSTKSNTLEESTLPASRAVPSDESRKETSGKDKNDVIRRFQPSVEAESQLATNSERNTSTQEQVVTPGEKDRTLGDTSSAEAPTEKNSEHRSFQPMEQCAPDNVVDKTTPLVKATEQSASQE